MALDTKIRKNLSGEFLMIDVEDFKEGIEYVREHKIQGIMLSGTYDIDNGGERCDFKELESLSGFLRYIAFSQTIGEVDNFDSIYSLKNLEHLMIDDKQKFTIDISKFPKLTKLGTDYWNGLINIGKAKTLKTVVICKLTDTNLKQFSELKRLNVLHVYSSKITSLDGIEDLNIESLSLAHCRALEDIQVISKLKRILKVEIEKCKKIKNHSILVDPEFLKRKKVIFLRLDW